MIKVWKCLSRISMYCITYRYPLCNLLLLAVAPNEKKTKKIFFEDPIYRVRLPCKYLVYCTLNNFHTVHFTSRLIPAGQTGLWDKRDRSPSALSGSLINADTCLSNNVDKLLTIIIVSIAICFSENHQF